jgi:hypothetical protein
MSKKIIDKTFHYTKPDMVIHLMDKIPFNKGDSVMDAGSGLNKVFYNFIPSYCCKYECEIDEGKDFLQDNQEYDWIIGNPPYHIAKDFLLHSAKIAKKGIAFLVNLTCLNSFLLPSRLKLMQSYNFNVRNIHIVQDKRWFCRYFFIIFSKDNITDINNLITFEEKSF